MILPVEKSLGILRPEAGLPASVPLRPEAGAEMLASWLEPRHALLLRVLLDTPETDLQLPGAPLALQRAGGIYDGLRRDARLAFAEFRDKWDSRLEAAALVRFLERSQWFIALPQGGVSLQGKGTRKEAHLLYLQTLHDMVSDCTRQWASLGGRLQALQTSFAADWHKESVTDDATKIIPALEAALRGAEFEVWKSLRLSLGEVAEEAFVRAVVRGESRTYPDAEALIHGIAAPWRGLHPGRNGFIGFARALSRLAENLALAMIDHYDRKWELLLRGFAEAPR